MRGASCRPNIGLFAASVIGPQAFDEISRPTEKYGDFGASDRPDGVLSGS